MSDMALGYPGRAMVRPVSVSHRHVLVVDCKLPLSRQGSGGSNKIPPGVTLCSHSSCLFKKMPGIRMYVCFSS